jgi:hypothetical protein
MWNRITLSHLCGPVESSKYVSFPHSAVQSSDVTIKVPLRHRLAGLPTGIKPNTTDNFHVPMVTSTAQMLHSAGTVYVSRGVLGEVRTEHIQGDQNVSVRLMITVQKNTKKYFKQFQSLTMIT